MIIDIFERGTIKVGKHIELIDIDFNHILLHITDEAGNTDKTVCYVRPFWTLFYDFEEDNKTRSQKPEKRLTYRYYYDDENEEIVIRRFYDIRDTVDEVWIYNIDDYISNIAIGTLHQTDKIPSKFRDYVIKELI